MSWAVALLDLVATVACLAAAGRRPDQDRRGRHFWVVTAAVSCVLGVNKQADLHSVALRTGRQVLEDHAALGYRPAALLAVTVVAAAGAAAILSLLWWLARPSRFRLALAAVGSLMVLAVLRAAVISHVDLVGVTPPTRDVVTAMEAAATAVLVLAAFRECIAVQAHPRSRSAALP
jgi:hypothetical protein